MNYADILGWRFRNIEWEMPDVSDYRTLRMISGAKPTRAAIEAEETEATRLITEYRAARERGEPDTEPR